MAVELQRTLEKNTIVIPRIATIIFAGDLKRENAKDLIGLVIQPHQNLTPTLEHNPETPKELMIRREFERTGAVLHSSEHGEFSSHPFFIKPSEKIAIPYSDRAHLEVYINSKAGTDNEVTIGIRNLPKGVRAITFPDFKESDLKGYARLKKLKPLSTEETQKLGWPEAIGVPTTPFPSLNNPHAA